MTIQIGIQVLPRNDEWQVLSACIAHMKVMGRSSLRLALAMALSHAPMVSVSAGGPDALDPLSPQRQEALRKSFSQVDEAARAGANPTLDSNGQIVLTPEDQKLVGLYRKCIADHKRELELRKATEQLLIARNVANIVANDPSSPYTARLQQNWAQNREAQSRYPGGLKQALDAELEAAFTEYRAAGGSATRAADVIESPSDPCPPARNAPLRSSVRVPKSTLSVP